MKVMGGTSSKEDSVNNNNNNRRKLGSRSSSLSQKQSKLKSQEGNQKSSTADRVESDLHSGDRQSNADTDSSSKISQTENRPVPMSSLSRKKKSSSAGITNTSSQAVTSKHSSQGPINGSSKKRGDDPLHINKYQQHKSEESDKNTTLISSFVSDDEVKVNLAMADLMAYLQVVANNSANLPLTRRDDPELPKTVSSLTADEYARKSAAFIPADVRVIAGSFTKYGRVWDLPTSEEFNAVDGAHEPGRSYGGACTNALLKVLYDAANETMLVHHDGGTNETEGDSEMMLNDSLFDDDEEESMLSNGAPVTLSRDRTFQSLVLGDVATQSSLSWATLLRKMKAEIAEIEYAQAPTLTTTRKFDINQPFTLIPPGFDDTKNHKRSLLIGCNYGNIQGAELKASHDDIRSMKDYIVNVHGFSEAKGIMTVLLDDDTHKHPTHLNITESFKALSELSQPGDAVFVHFSGHGGRVLDEESYDEVIVPSDFQTSGIIRDTLIFKTLLAPMRYGVTVTILIDCCDTGMVLDLPYSWTTKTDRIETLAKLTLNDDFSFVRFLKVVKTLYEASTFTQLGKTVGSALNTSGNELDEDLGEESETVDDTQTKSTLQDVESKPQKSKGVQRSFFSALGACNDSGQLDNSSFNNNSNINNKHGGGGSMATTPRKQNFLEKVLNCTLTADDDGSDYDDDVYTRGDDDMGTTTFETEDESYVHRRRRR
jgi:hypothetical protein